MTGSNGQAPSPVRAVDSLFVQMAEGNGSVKPYLNPNGLSQPVGPSADAPPQPAPFHPAGWPDPPSVIDSVPELREAYQWLQGERQRLEEYTRGQFANIRRQHQELLAHHFRKEEAVALRTQELNREMAFVAAQAKIIQQRAAELAVREKALAAQIEKLFQAQGAAGQAAPAGPRSAWEELRTETARLRGSPETGPGQLAEVESALRERQSFWETRQEEITERLAQMERRYRALEEAEEATRRRVAELDELEARLTREFEKQERQLALERRQIETLRARLRLQGVDPDQLESTAVS